MLHFFQNEAFGFCIEHDIVIVYSHRSPFLQCGYEKNGFYSSVYGDNMWLKNGGNKILKELPCLIKIKQTRNLQ